MTVTRSRTRVRIVNHDDVVHNARLLIVDYDEDGNELETRDITEDMRITGLEVSLKVGEVSRAKVECLCVGAEVDATLDEVVVRHVGSSRWARMRWRITKLWWRQKEVTALGQRYRSYIRP